MSSVYSVENTEKSSLLACLTGKKGHISLAFKERVERVEKDVKEIKPSVTPKTVQNNVESEDLDLTGDPLQAGFDPNEEWDVSEVGVETVTKGRNQPKYVGLSLSQARSWLSDDTNPSKGTEQWALVEVSSNTGWNTVYLGSKEEGESRVLSKISISGPSLHRSLQTQLDAVVLERHRLAGGWDQYKGSALAEYVLCGGQQQGETGLTVRAAWNTVSWLLQAPPLDCNLTLSVELMEGDQSLATRGLEQELHLLTGFVRGLGGEGVTWLGAGDGESGLDVGVQELLEGIRTGVTRSGFTKIEKSEMSVLTLGDKQDELENVDLNLQSRQDVDFTDQLWSVLCRATSYAQLTEAFRTVFDTIALEELRPFVYARNKTQVVRLVQGLVRGEIDGPDLTGSKPLELLIECGLEKLRRDYSHTLLSSELAGRDAVVKFLGYDDELSSAVSFLARLHRVVEVVSLTQTFLSLPVDCMRGVVQVALAKLEQQDTTSFLFPLPPAVVKDQLARMRPSSWQVRVTSGGVETVAHLVAECPEELHGREGGQVSVGEEDSQDPEYYCAVMTSITRKPMTVQSG